MNYLIFLQVVLACLELPRNSCEQHITRPCLPCCDLNLKLQNYPDKRISWRREQDLVYFATPRLLISRPAPAKVISALLHATQSEHPPNRCALAPDAVSACGAGRRRTRTLRHPCTQWTAATLAQMTVDHPQRRARRNPSHPSARSESECARTPRPFACGS